MKQYKFSLKDECMKELPLMEEPKSDLHFVEHGLSKLRYKEHLASLQSIPAPKEFLSSFIDGKIYNEDEFYKQGIIWDIKNGCELKNYGNELDWTKYEVRNIAVPKQKVDDTELWNEVLNALGYGFVNREKFIKEAQEHYTITRKI